MKYIYAMILLVIALMIFLQILAVSKKQSTKLIKAIFFLCISALVIVCSYIAAILTTSERAAVVLYGICSFFSMIAAFSYYYFVCETTGMNRFPVWFQWLLFILAGVDLILFVVNIFRRNVFDVILKEDSLSQRYYVISDYKEAYLFHCILLYLVVFEALFILIRKSLSMSKVYRRKYNIFAYMVFIIGAVDVLDIIYKASFDYSLIFYGSMALSVYYFSFVYVPKGLLNRFMSILIQENADGFVFFDLFGQCRFENEKARDFFRLRDEKYNLEDILARWLDGKDMQDMPNSLWETGTEKDGNKYFYKVEFRQAYDDKQQYIGCFFMVHDETEEIRTEREEMYEATHDSLTGVYNRDYFLERATQQIKDNPDVNYCIVCTDILDFKMINDMFGVEKGDEILLKSVELMRNTVKEGVIYGRIGSDRFALCMPRERFIEEDFIGYANSIGHMTAINAYQAKQYIGVYENVGTDVPLSVICDRTVQAINTVKGNMQETVVFYDVAFRRHILNIKQLTSDFNNSLRDRKFDIYLQPQVTEDGKVFGAEAFVRWFHPIRGMMPPNEFLPIFEQTGLISRMDVYVWELACRRLRRWKELGADDLYISVNVSPLDFYYIDVYETLTTLVEQHEVDPKKLCLEITEEVVKQDVGRLLETLTKLREYGFYIGLDDFGRGYSSLNILKDLPISVLKIDMEFLRGISRNEKNRLVLNTIIALSEKIGLHVVAEGVETESQLRYLSRLGCERYQGFYFCKPIPVKAFEEKYLR